MPYLSERTKEHLIEEFEKAQVVEMSLGEKTKFKVSSIDKKYARTIALHWLQVIENEIQIHNRLIHFKISQLTHFKNDTPLPDVEVGETFISRNKVLEIIQIK